MALPISLASPSAEEPAPPPGQAQGASARWLLRRVAGLLRGEGRASALVMGAIALHLAFSTFLALSFKFLVDYAILPGRAELLWMILGALAGLFALTAVADIAHDYLLAGVCGRALTRLRGELLAQLERIPAWSFAQAPLGALPAHLAHDVATAELGLGRALPKLWGAAVRVLVCLAIMVILDWRLALLTLLILPLGVLGPRLVGARAARASERRKAAEARLLQAAQERIATHALAHAFQLHAVAGAATDAALSELERQSRRADFLGRLVGRISDIGQTAGQVLIVAAGATLTFYGAISVGSLLAFFGMVFNMGSALFAIAEQLPDLIQTASGLRRIDAFCAAQPPLADAPDAGPLAPPRETLAVRGLTIRSPEQRALLDDITCAVPLGGYVALVGRSGCGKSTLLNAIMRFCEPSAGAISIDGRDLRQVTRESLRAQVRMVFQEPLLMSTTIRENIRMGKLDASDAEIEAAARAAEVHAAICALPGGYDTLVGERGAGLSGGQRQRISLARALIGKPAILLLDEATSALDPETEAAINGTLERLAGSCTIISATHRLEAIQRADQILVLDQGRLAEQGAHEELLDQHGLYFRLWEQQHGFVAGPDGRLMVTPQRLRAVPLFAGLEDGLLGTLAAMFASSRVRAGTVIIAEDTPGDSFYLLVRGAAEVIKQDEAGAEHRLALMQDGDVFGEIALLGDVPRTAMVRARTSCTLLALAREQFLALMGSAPELRQTLAEMAARRLVVQPAQAAPFGGAEPPAA